eukprot:TRINITY_DN45483_c0_g1_i1.p1 TRINITY_DN45483_c0_g1~~TRINITY_DN45483_c0_g1_i1.p1  ORF type:complete len:516 (+),score=71.31 TRINITY_DN45483_c0_g1_i1:85-1632(+)
MAELSELSLSSGVDVADCKLSYSVQNSESTPSAEESEALLNQDTSGDASEAGQAESCGSKAVEPCHIGNSDTAAKSQEGAGAYLETVLAALQLSGFLDAMRKLGVQHVADIGVLDVGDFEEIGLSRLQARRLQQAARDIEETPTPPQCAEETKELVAASLSVPPSILRPRSGARSRSAENRGARERSVSFGRSSYTSGTSKSTFRSRASSRASGSIGDFARDSTNCIVDALRDSCREVAPRTYGISDCDLVLQMQKAVQIDDLLPGVLFWATPNKWPRNAIPSSAILVLMTKSSVGRLHRAVDRLQKRVAHMAPHHRSRTWPIVVVQFDSENDEEFDAMKKVAEEFKDITIAGLDTEKLRQMEVEQQPGPIGAIAASASNAVHEGASLIGGALRNRKVQLTLTSSATGAVATGLVGGVAGTIAGVTVGGALGVIPSFFTFGLSIPAGATIGGGLGCCIGTAAGSSVGAVGGGIAGYAELTPLWWQSMKRNTRLGIRGVRRYVLKKATSLLLGSDE